MASFPTSALRRPLSLAAVALVALGLGAAVASCGTSTHAQAAPARTQPLETIFEAPQDLTINPAATLDAIKRLGAARVKVFMLWAEVAPNPLSRVAPTRFDAASPAAYSAAAWAPYDTIVRDAAARGIGLDLSLGAPAPRWATGSGLPPGTAPSFVGSWKPSAKAFGSFVEAVAKRYSGSYKPPGEASPLPRVNFWSIWNEPNYGQQLAPQAIDHSTVEVSPASYRLLLNAAWTALQRTGHSGDTVLIGEVAPRGQTIGDQPGNFSGMVPLRFIRALYCVDGSLRPLGEAEAAPRGCPTDATGSAAFARENPALFHASGFAFHPYPQGVPPTVRTPDEPDYADLPQVPELERTLDGALAAYGSSTRFPLYDTEFGYQTNPPEKILRAINPTTAAAYINWAEYLHWLNPRIASYDQYLLTDPPPGASSFDTGLQLYGGKHKALYAAFRLPVYLPVTSGRRGHPLEVWGCVRPAHYVMVRSRVPQLADIQFQPAAGGAFKTVKRIIISDPYGYFDTRVVFPATGVARIAWAYPHGPRIHSRSVGVTVR